MTERMTMLITGASGLLGRSLLGRPDAAGHLVRAMSRRGAPRSAAGQAPNIEWVVADLATGAGLDAAVEGANVVIHAASDPRGDARRTDVIGTELLLAAAERAGVRHVVYVSIVGIDRVPYPYYRLKLAAEDRIRSARVPWTILRGTQFHDLMDVQFRRLARFPVVLLPKSWLGQPVHVDEFADALWACVTAGPSRRAPDVAGPEVLRYGDMMRVWLTAQRRRKLVLNLPLPGRTAGAFRRGGATAPGRAVGRLTWGAWVRAKYASATSQQQSALDRSARPG
ncbi:MAG: SDR family oxidoreductase [Gemmatimonadaceae bacterium]